MRRRYSSTMRRSFSPPCTQQYTPIALGDDIQGVKDGGEGRKHIVQDKASAGQALLHSLGHGGGMIKIAVAHQLGDVGVHAGLPRQPLPGRISWTKDTKNRQPACMVGWRFLCAFSLLVGLSVAAAAPSVACGDSYPQPQSARASSLVSVDSFSSLFVATGDASFTHLPEGAFWCTSLVAKTRHAAEKNVSITMHRGSLREGAVSGRSPMTEGECECTRCIMWQLPPAGNPPCRGCTGGRGNPPAARRPRTHSHKWSRPSCAFRSVPAWA